MTSSMVARFFQEMARHLSDPIAVLLVGGAAAAVQGRARATQDVDFEIRVASPDSLSAEGVAAARRRATDAVARARAATGIAAQFSEDIDRWSSISLGDYRRHVRRWRRFGPVTVRLLEPAYFAIGKLARGTASDLSDVTAVFRRQRVSWRRAAQVWGEALRRSPLSDAVPLFTRQVEHFFARTGPGLWGRSFRSEAAIALFRRAARGR